METRRLQKQRLQNQGTVASTIGRQSHYQEGLLMPKGSKYHYSSYLVAIWAPKVHTILVLGPFGYQEGLLHVCWPGTRLPEVHRGPSICLLPLPTGSSRPWHIRDNSGKGLLV